MTDDRVLVTGAMRRLIVHALDVDADAELQASEPFSRQEALYLAALLVDAYIATAVPNGMMRAQTVGLADHLVEQAIQHEVNKGILDLNLRTTRRAECQSPLAHPTNHTPGPFRRGSGDWMSSPWWCRECGALDVSPVPGRQAREGCNRAALVTRRNEPTVRRP